MIRRRIASFAFGLALLAIALPARASGPDWTQWQGDAGHTGSNNAETTISSSNAASLHVLWTAPAQHVVVQSGVVYVARLQHRAALDATTGTPAWVKRGHAAWIAVSGDRAVISGASNRHDFVKAYDAATGDVVWQHSCMQDRSGPVIDGGTVYVACSGFVKAWELEAGTRVWSVAGAFQKCAAPAVDGGRAYVTGPNIGVRALDTANGSTLWQSAAPVTARKGPSANGTNLLYANHHRRVFVARSEVTGARAWSLQGDYVGQAVDANGIYVDARGVLRAVDPGSGALQWTRRVTRLTAFNAMSSPIVANGLVYVGVATTSGPKVAVVDAATGSRVARLSVPVSTTSAPKELAVSEGQLYVTDGGVVTVWGP
jgi:outer membrane protein assembly factor BamB